jgi:chromate transport protein ChrA
LNLVLIPLMTGILGVLVTTLVYVPLALVIDRWSSKAHFKAWLPALVAAAACATFVAVLVVLRVTPPNPAKNRLGLLMVAAAGLSVGFAFHWTFLILTGAALRRRGPGAVLTPSSS